ncbi:MAG: archaetidylserine decarboxylase [Myxococcales bacterium]
MDAAGEMPAGVGLRAWFQRLGQQAELNYVLTNRVISRRFATRFMGWFSKLEQPLIRDLSIATWKLFTDLDLSDAKKSEFKSMHDLFVRQLKPGARPIESDPSLLVSPCDGLVAGHGRIDGVNLIQAKGMGYTLMDLLGEQSLVDLYRDGTYVTLRLTSSMYHRFHAPYDLSVKQVNYKSGDTWNTNFITLERVAKLYCKNERAILRTTVRQGTQEHVLTLVPVAAILVASIRLHCLDVLLHLAHKGPDIFHCDARYGKGEEMGWFEHGSTIIVFAPKGFTLCDPIREGYAIRMGQPLLRMPLFSARAPEGALRQPGR